MEYVGEVFDSREFKRRRKEYSRNHNAHFYFMGLKGDLFIDATRKGNISRFINHSCDPNAQTQKWTVNGELRVGFFATKDIEVGEEINFDYRLERYGREPQRCFCGTAVCRGWLGESPDEKTKEEKEEEKRLERDKRKREAQRPDLEDVVLEEEIEKLNTIKLRTRQDILNLCRLMVRVDNSSSRMKLLQLVQSSTSACKRLFMDYHGLSVLWSWMADLGYIHEHASTKIEILKTLEYLPITNKTQLTDSRVLGVVERWSTQLFEMPPAGSPPPPPPPRPDHLTSGSSNVDSDVGKKSSDTSEDSDAEPDAKPVSTNIDSSSMDDVSMDSSDVEQDAVKSKPSLEGCMAEEDSSDSNLSDENKELKKRGAVVPGEGDSAATTTADEATMQELLGLHGEMVEISNKLLEQWRNLKEYFRIPKKERIELMKEHEREVEEEIRGLDKDRKEKDKYKRDFDRRRRSPDREKDKDPRHNRRSGRSERDPREDRSSDSPKMSKEQRRQLFEIQVQQEEEEAKQRKMQEEMWAMHVDRCRLLGQDPYLTPIFDPTCQYYWDPNNATWQRYNGTDPNLPVPAAYGHLVNGSGDGSPVIVSMPPGSVIAAAGQPVIGHVATEGEAASPNKDDPRIDLSTIPLPGEAMQTSPTQPLPGQAVPVEGTPPQGAQLLTVPVTGGETGVVTPAVPINIGTNAVAVPFVVGEEPPPPPPPGPITIQLPPRWKMARDSEGHVYFYHTKTRTSQWEPPSVEQHQQLEAGLGSDSDSDSSSSDSESTSSSDSEDFSSDEEVEKEQEQVTVVERGELTEEKMVRHHRAKKPRSEALVQERVISPVLEVDKETARRERREAKERAQKEVRQERQEDRVAESSQELIENEDGESLLEKKGDNISEKERLDKIKNRDRVKSKERAASAIADNSDTARKCKENFRAKMATYIVSVLNPYRRDDCRIGRITCNDDFKYLARKLTHFVMIKELKQLHSVEDLECNDSVKYKTKDFVRKYMSKYGEEFKRDPTDTKEY
ncbi:Histone-lysine N-methyltransferase setd2 [Halocaridina rubra]|uniref:[histone H3]-lysine(36) N-trimethyltransferase n=1 Tax=Halocaridina rubra TaxID=373956 RepID=A0AAN8WT27_HALRR